MTYDNNDPWQKKRREDPPNLDEIFEGLNLSFLQGDYGFFFFPLLVLLVALVLWIVSGFYIVKPAQEAIVLRFGKYFDSYGPGLHWIARGIDNKYIVNTSRIYAYNYSDQMLTEDENYVKAAITVFYRIDSPKDYLFNVRDPEDTLFDAVHSALRQTIGHTDLEEVLTSGKEVVRSQTAKLLNEVLDSYGTGIEVTDVKLQEATVPQSVIAAFDDVITARETKAAKISQGERYVKKVVPLAKGKSDRILEEAHAYHAKIVLNAQADVARFLALLPEFSASPDIIQSRLYLETMQTILGRVDKVFVNNSKQILNLSTSHSKPIHQSGNTLADSALAYASAGEDDIKVSSSLLDSLQNNQ